MKQLTSNRRKFLKAGLASAIFTPSIASSKNINSNIQHACIGVGGMMGYNDYKNISSHSKTKVVAICDVDENYLDKVSKEIPEARTYTDWRELMEKEGDKIDSVNVTVPDLSLIHI